MTTVSPDPRIGARRATRWLCGSAVGWTLLCCSVLLVGCSANLTCLSPPGGEYTLELAYSQYVGESHTFTLARVYSSGLVEIEPGGQRRRCRRLPQAVTSSLSTRIDSESFKDLLQQKKEEAQEVEDFYQYDFLGIQGPGFRADLHPEQLTGVLREVVLEVDSILRDEFPTLAERYLYRIE